MLTQGNLYRDNVSRLIGWGHWLVFFNILLAMAVSSRYLLISGWPDTAFGVVYMLISWAGHFAFLTFITYLLTLFPLTFLFPRVKVVLFMGATITTAALTLLLVDTQVFSLFKFHLNPTVWRLLLEQIQAQGATGWGWLFIWVPVLFLFELWLATWLWRWCQRGRRSLALPLALPLLVCFFLTHSLHIWADAWVYSPITHQKANFPLSYPMTAKSFLIKQGWLDENQHQQLTQEASANQHKVNYPLRPLNVMAPEHAPNILLVVADGLRADQLDAITMPNLQRFAERNLRFNNHLSAGNQTNTALFSLFYSLPTKYQADMTEAGIGPILIDELQRQDYRLSMFVSGGLDDDLYKKAIFSTLRHRHFSEASGGALGDQQAVSDFSHWITQQNSERPWFSFVYLDALNTLDLPTDVAGPFQPSLEQLNPSQTYDDTQKKALLNRYRNAVFYTDRLIGQLLALSRSQIERDTLVIVTSGHGMEFNDMNNNTWGYGNAYSPAQLQVPLVLGWPGQSSPAVIEHPTSHLDVVPTLLSQVLGVQNVERNYSTGQSLFKDTPKRWRLASDTDEYAIYQKQQITLFNRRGDVQLLRLDDYQTDPDANPELSLLLQVMSDLNRFQSD